MIGLRQKKWLTPLTFGLVWGFYIFLASLFLTLFVLLSNLDSPVSRSYLKPHIIDILARLYPHIIELLPQSRPLLGFLVVERYNYLTWNWPTSSLISSFIKLCDYFSLAFQVCIVFSLRSHQIIKVFASVFLYQSWCQCQFWSLSVTLWEVWLARVSSFHFM